MKHATFPPDLSDLYDSQTVGGVDTDAELARVNELCASQGMLIANILKVGFENLGISFDKQAFLNEAGCALDTVTRAAIFYGADLDMEGAVDLADKVQALPHAPCALALRGLLKDLNGQPHPCSFIKIDTPL